MTGPAGSDERGVIEGQIPSDAKGKPLARVGRKATDLDVEEAELPDRRHEWSWFVNAN